MHNIDGETNFYKKKIKKNRDFNKDKNKLRIKDQSGNIALKKEMNNIKLKLQKIKNQL